MYHSGSTQSSPSALPGGSEIGSTHSSSVRRCSGDPASAVCVQPARSMTGTTTRPKSHTGGSSRVVRLRSTRHGLPGERSSDPATREPARANMMPIDGKSSGSQAHPNAW